MSDTLQPCLIDVTNNNATSLVLPSEDDILSSQNDSDQVPQLSSPSPASTVSSPSSSQVELTNPTNSGKRSYPTITRTCLSLETSAIDQNHQYIHTPSATTNGVSCDDDSVGDVTNQTDSQQKRCRHNSSTDLTIWKDMPAGVDTHCQECYADENTTTTSLMDTTYSNTTALKRRRLDDEIQQQKHLEISTNSITELQDLPTLSPVSTSTSSQSRRSCPSLPPIRNSSSSFSSQPISTDKPSASLATADSTIHNSTQPANTLRVCLECNASDPPLWRNGPDGKKTLCNACGLRYSKFVRGVIPHWQRTTQPSDGQKKKPNKKRSSEETTPLAKPERISSATSVVMKKNAAAGGNTLLDSRLKKCDTLHERKTYLKAGMHSGGFKMMDPVPFTFSLPLHQGAILLNLERDFELPLDIIEEYESGRLFGWTDYSSSKKPPRYIRILHNSYVERKARKEEHNAACHCLPSANGVGCGDDCLNRMMFIECDPSTCPCGDLCSNQRFRKRQFVKGLKVYLTEGRGWGIMAKEFIQQGTLITEYRGEIISDKTCQERIRTVYKHQKNFYFLDYHKGEVIDACSKGSEARFINHGCDPNCHIEKWSRGGEFHLGVFASKDIPVDTELFYDYNFSLFDTEAIGQECCCGSSNCRGFLGKRPTHHKK